MADHRSDDGDLPPGERERMLATLSHDLKNPLSAVLVGAQNLTRLSVPDDVAPRLQRYAQAIQRAGQRMNDLLHDLMDLTRLEGGTMPLDRRSRDAALLVAAALAPLEAAAAARQIALHPAVPAGLIALCDQRLAAQAIGNVVSNAVKYSRDGGSVDITVQRDGGELTFTVRDTGQGITPEEFSKIFGPYWRDSDNPRSGMGVGLPIAKAIIDAHGGRIWAESTEGQGSTFFLTLPSA